MSDVCGKPWCTVKHGTTNLRRMSHEARWRSQSRESNPLLASMYPCPAVGPDRPDGHVFFAVASHLPGLGVQPTRSMPYTAGAVLHVDDLRALAVQLLELCDWTDEQSRLQLTDPILLD